MSTSQPLPQQVSPMQEHIGDKPNDYLIFSILNTIFCCWLFGSIAIIYSVRVSTIPWLRLKVAIISHNMQSIKTFPLIHMQKTHSTLNATEWNVLSYSYLVDTLVRLRV